MTSAKRSKSKPSSSQPRIALALAGGGPLGAIYEIGALCALDESLQGISFTELHHYVGVSAGGFIAAGLANGMTPRELCAAFIENDDKASEVFDPAWLMVPAYGEFLRRGITRNTLKKGDKIVVDGYQSKDGSKRANGRDMTLPNGQKLFLGSSGGEGAPYEVQRPGVDVVK